MIIACLVVVILLMGLGLAALANKLLNVSEKFEEVTDQIEESLDILDDCYRRISKIAEMPVASDDPVVRQLLSDIKLTKKSILLIANKISSPTPDEVDD